MSEFIKYRLHVDNKRGSSLRKYINDTEFYLIEPNEFTENEKKAHDAFLKVRDKYEQKHDYKNKYPYLYIRQEENNNIEPELKYYTYGFECSNIDNLKSKEEKDIIYNKILNLFEEQLKNWIYEK